MERPPGTHPNEAEARNIVLAACAPEHPNARLTDALGHLYPLAAGRSLFAVRVVRGVMEAGFRIERTQVPAGDHDTLGAVVSAVVAFALPGDDTTPIKG